MTTIALTSGYKHCRAVGCSHSARTNTRLSFFRFPKDERRCGVWLKNCGLDSSNFTTESCYNNMRLCSVHFEDEMFASLHKNRLKKTSVPTLFSHGKEVEKVIFEEVPTPKKIKKRSFKKGAVKKSAASKKVVQKKSASAKIPSSVSCSPIEQVSLVVTPDVYSMTLNGDYEDENACDEDMYNDSDECNYQSVYDNEIEYEDEDEERYNTVIPKVELNDSNYTMYSSVEESFRQRISKNVEISAVKSFYNYPENVSPRIPRMDIGMSNYRGYINQGNGSQRIPKSEVEMSSYQNVHNTSGQENITQKNVRRDVEMSSYQNVYINNAHENGYLRIPKSEVEISNHIGNRKESVSDRIPKIEVDTSYFQSMYGNGQENNQCRSMLSGSSSNDNSHLNNGVHSRVNGEQPANSELKPKVTVDDFMDFCDSYFNKNLAAFIKSQIQLQELHGNIPKGIRYDETFKELALSIYTLDPKVYKFLSKTFHLPSKSTLMRISRNV